MTMAGAAEAAGVAKNIICKWCEACRNVCTSTESTLPKLVGTIVEEPLQIDEYYFAGKRKYNRGRLADGDKKAVGEDKA